MVTNHQIVVLYALRRIKNAISIFIKYFIRQLKVHHAWENNKFFAIMPLKKLALRSTLKLFSRKFGLQHPLFIIISFLIVIV